MGRTVPTFRNIIESFGMEWNDFKRALREMDREAFDELMNHERLIYTKLAHNASPATMLWLTLGRITKSLQMPILRQPTHHLPGRTHLL